jgi:5-methylcytosine-specific restriction endonuclease McrA
MITDDDDDTRFDSLLAEIEQLSLRISREAAIALAAKAVSTGCSAATVIESIIADWAESELRCYEAASELLANPKSDDSARRSRERGAMTPSLRLAVLQRDGHTCRSCGARAPEAKLHVDHMTAIANGGKTTMDNLQTLCEPCNLAKAAKVIELPEGSRK